MLTAINSCVLECSWMAVLCKPWQQLLIHLRCVLAFSSGCHAFVFSTNRYILDTGKGNDLEEHDGNRGLRSSPTDHSHGLVCTIQTSCTCSALSFPQREEPNICFHQCLHYSSCINQILREAFVSELTLNWLYNCHGKEKCLLQSRNWAWGRWTTALCSPPQRFYSL